MIKIIKGTYGYLDENGIVKPKTSKDKPFALSEEQEARLVGLGVAEYVTEHEPDSGQDTGINGDVGATLDPEQLEEMTNAKLKELAEDMGIDTKKLKTKAQLIEAITSVEVDPGPAEDDAQEDAEDDGEPLPDFDPSEAVQ